jgi:hypothetical protein
MREFCPSGPENHYHSTRPTPYRLFYNFNYTFHILHYYPMPLGHYRRSQVTGCWDWIKARYHVLHRSFLRLQLRWTYSWLFVLSSFLFQAWMVVPLAAISFIITIIYSWDSKVVSSIPSIGGSPKYAIRALSFLSVLTTSILLVAAINLAVNSLRESSIGDKGLNYLTYLTLQGNNSPFSYARIIFHGLFSRFSRRPPLRIFQRPFSVVSARLWSILRLVTMILPPVLGFLLLSKLISSLCIGL